VSYSSEVLADSPVAYYRMDESSGQPQDSSGTGNNTTATGGTPTYSQVGALASDPTSTAILFSPTPSEEYFTAPDHATLDLADVFTIEAWLKLTSSDAGNHCYLTKGTNAYYMAINAQRLQLSKAFAVDMVASTITITDTTTWHHCVGTKNGSTMALYVDGVDVTGTPTNATCADNTETLSIGALPGFSLNFDGALDEIAVYPTALSAARVLAHYHAAFNGLAWIKA
jgi:hypothetical protein